jgi:hypothetical protein
MNCSPALQCISIRRFEREVLGFPRFQVNRGQYGDCKIPTGKQQFMHSKVCNLACLRTRIQRPPTPNTLTSNISIRSRRNSPCV